MGLPNDRKHISSTFCYPLLHYLTRKWHTMNVGHGGSKGWPLNHSLKSWWIKLCFRTIWGMRIENSEIIDDDALINREKIAGWIYNVKQFFELDQTSEVLKFLLARINLIGKHKCGLKCVIVCVENLLMARYYCFLTY